MTESTLVTLLPSFFKKYIGIRASNNRLDARERWGWRSKGRERKEGKERLEKKRDSVDGRMNNLAHLPINLMNMKVCLCNSFLYDTVNNILSKLCT